MKFLYNFGMSQDDAETERVALDLENKSRLVCIASAGELPLNLLASSSLQIDAVDISKSQLNLAKLKMNAAIHLDPPDAAKLIGYYPGSSTERVLLYNKLSHFLESADRNFWNCHPAIFEKGPIHSARYEKYLSYFSWLGVKILGRKKLMQLFEFDDLEKQKQYFDSHLDSRRLKNIFKVVFHPKIFRKRGMDEQGLIHSGKRNIAEFFFSRFRNFCTNTIARQNYFLQMTLFNQVLFEEALPQFLNANGNNQLRNSAGNLSFFNESISGLIRRKPTGYYDSFALSNVGDWISREDFIDLLRIIGSKAAAESRLLLRYIHLLYPFPENLSGVVAPDPQWGAKLESVDRYPFVYILPMRILPG